MKIGMPRGLLYARYHVFARVFLEEIGAEIIESPPTSKQILDAGVACCADDACLPMKVFHGHVCWLRDRCDALFVPRFFGVRQHEYICPMFCGLPEMLRHNIDGLPALIDTEIRSIEHSALSVFAIKAGAAVTADKKRIMRALDGALVKHRAAERGINDGDCSCKAGLVGHVYNLYDEFINMNLIEKLRGLGIGVVTAETVSRREMDCEVQNLYKKPFWCFGSEYYGAALCMCRKKLADGIIYLSSFSCGVDSVIVELIKNRIGDFPFMVLKLDEHTGEAGFVTRIEAFSDMLKRRTQRGHHLS